MKSHTGGGRWRLRLIVPVVLLVTTLQEHVAVALRNQKVSTSGDPSRVTQVSDAVSIPALSQLTICFEAQRSSHTPNECLFTYYDSSNEVALSLCASGNRMAMVMGGLNCILPHDLSPAYFTAQMKPVCLAWASGTGRFGVYLNGTQRPSTCHLTAGHSVPGGGTFRLGGQQSFDGYIYNLRLWDTAMSEAELRKLTCDAEGNIIDWDQSNWTIPQTLAQTDAALSCSVSPTNRTPTVSRCDSSQLSCIEWLNYQAAFVVDDGSSTLNLSNVEQAAYDWVRQSFSNWSHNLFVNFASRKCSLQSGGGSARYQCRVLLKTLNDANRSLDEAAASSRLSSTAAHVGHGLQIQSGSITVRLIVGTCPEEDSGGYHWPKTTFVVTRYLDCLFNTDKMVYRTCRFDPDSFSLTWSPVYSSECVDISSISVSADNAVEVAERLVSITNSSGLSVNNVSDVVKKVEELVKLPKLNSTLASTVIGIISNVMTNSEAPQANASEIYAQALQTVDTLAQKIEFEGPTVTISSRNLIVGIRALNTTAFSGMSFSAFKPPNSDVKIDFDSEKDDALAKVTLPDSLLSSHSLSEADKLSLSRINFMFFSSTKFFLQKQDGRSLNSYVVASSVGNVSIRNLRDPVTIEIAHLSAQSSPNPVCVFWDFSMNNQSGGWNSEGCNVSSSSSNRTVCQCDHLTHFGILMDISRTSPHLDSRNNEILTFISYVGCGISAIFTAVTLLTYITFEKLRRDYPSKILMNLSASLLFLNMVFLLDGWLASLDNPALCQAVAFCLHYFLLTSFTWMGLESVHMYIALVKVFNTYVRRYILKFCMVGWGVPLVVALIVISVDHTNYGWMNVTQSDETEKFCFIQSPAVFYTTCVGYFCLVFLLNVAMFVVVMMQICGRNGKRSNRTLREEVLRNLRSAVSLTFLLGMTWGFALFSWGPVSIAFMYLFTIFNSLQGLFIFIFHCALKENVQKQWRRYLCCSQFKPSDNSDWSKTATNNTKKLSSDTLGKSLSSSSFGSSATNWTSKAKATLNPFTRRHVNTDKPSQSSPRCVSSCSSSEVEPNSSSSSSSILPVSQMIDKVKGYCSTRTDNFYKNIILSDSYTLSTRF